MSVLDINSTEDARAMYDSFTKAGCCREVADDLTVMLRVVNALPLEKKEDRYTMIEFMMSEYFGDSKSDEPDVIEISSPAHCDIQQVNIEPIQINCDAFQSLPLGAVDSISP